MRVKDLTNDVLSYSQFDQKVKDDESKDSSIADESGDPGMYSMSADEKSVINDIYHQRNISSFF